ncbi:sulfotransferase [Microbulbifer bruguierae]|uniref:Sulfotransferase n=1 Tax=Microbulbifer bruguierae TaxID=3029061 RepID=A0ABY8NDM7_9GAMM|nr:tetratricopeptide repeat-containing sulfotransferase family protein [Microbulbifer bruguierae]WGL16509.1 sulfotransferase [Microbulbifer bruguierae]
MSLAEMAHLAQQQLVEQRDQEAYQTLATLLKCDPSNANAYYLLSHIAHKFRNYSKEVELLSQALRLEPDSLRYKVFLARAMAFYGDGNRAKSALDQIDLSLIEDVDLVDAVATTYNRLYLYTEACRGYEKLVGMKGISASSWFNLGICYKYVGKFSKSREALLQAIALQPNYYKAQAALSSLGGCDADDARIRALRELLEQAPGNDSRLHIGHALARELERAGHYSESIDVLNKAKSPEKVRLSYAFSSDQSVFAKVHQNLVAIKSPSNHKVQTVKDIFIVGMPRTGTTLLDRILSGLAGVVSGGELYNFNMAFKKVMNLNGREFASPTDLEINNASKFKQIGDLYEETTAYLRTGKVLTNKLPVNFLYAQQIMESLPDSIIICLDRHPLDTIVGNFRQLFSFDDAAYRYTLDLQDIAKYYLSFKQLTECLADVYRKRFYVLNYEMLVSSPETEVRKLLSFCGLPWEPGCLNIEANHTPVATASSVQVREGIHSKSIGQWRRYQGCLSEAAAILLDGRISL